MTDKKWSYAEGYEHAMNAQRVYCSCGCGYMINVGPRYFNSACRSRAKRKRDKDG